MAPVSRRGKVATPLLVLAGYLLSYVGISLPTQLPLPVPCPMAQVEG
jgi:hypothetical protein